MLAIASESYGTIIQYIGSVISCSPLFNKSFIDAYNYICKDNEIKKKRVYDSLFMNNKTFYIFKYTMEIYTHSFEASKIACANKFDEIMANM